MKSGLIRVFISINFQPRELAFLNALIGTLQTDTSESLRWIAAENLHLTLKFIGNVNAKQVKAIGDSLQTIAEAQSPFNLKFGDLGTFPKTHPQKILFIDISGELQALCDLQEMIEKEMIRLGLPPESNPFLPHVSLARIKRHLKLNELKQVFRTLDPEKVDSGLSFGVSEISLMQSILKTSGPIYQVLQTEVLQNARYSQC